MSYDLEGCEMQDFRKLKVWQKSHELVLAVYAVTKGYPKEKLFGLTSQTRRATASIAMNICEGTGRSSDADFARFLNIAYASSCEVDYQLLLAKDLGYVSAEQYEDMISMLLEVKRMLNSLMHTVRNT